MGAANAVPFFIFIKSNRENQHKVFMTTIVFSLLITLDKLYEVLLIAGEASGDMHAANLMKELRFLDNEAYFQVLVVIKWYNKTTCKALQRYALWVFWKQLPTPIRSKNHFSK